MSKQDFAGQLVGLEAIEKFVFGGAARFTVVSKKTGARYTYRLQLPKDKIVTEGDVKRWETPGGPKGVYPPASREEGPFFVKVLTGDDNESSYTFAGTVRRPRSGAYYTHSRKSAIGPVAPSVVAFEWFLKQLRDRNAASLEQCEVFHDGTCGRCGRALTVPESVASGLGPICAGRE